jgi:uncharacterized protein
MQNPLWNAEEGRLRALWRLILQTIIFLLLTGVFSSLVLLLPSSGAALESQDLIDPSSPELLDAVIQQDPLFAVTSSLAVLFGTVASVWLAGKWLDKRPFASFGLHINSLWGLDLLFGLGLGAVLMAGVFFFQLAAGWIEVTGTTVSEVGDFTTAILIAAILFIGVGILEELLSRGYHLRNIAEGFNHPRLGARNALLVGYVLSSSIFGLLHFANPGSSLISTINLIIAGLFLGLGYILTGELGIPIGLHITWNFFQGNVFGFPVSGADTGATFIAIQQGGPDTWTGGAFGPEAGLIGLIAILVGSLLTIAYVRWTRGRAQLQTHLAEYSPPEN